MIAVSAKTQQPLLRPVAYCPSTHWEQVQAWHVVLQSVCILVHWQDLVP